MHRKIIGLFRCCSFESVNLLAAVNFSNVFKNKKAFEK